MPYGIFELFGVIAGTVGNTLLASENLDVAGQGAPLLAHLAISVMNLCARRPIHD